MSQAKTLTLLSPVARIVVGHPMEAITTDDKGQPLKTKDGKDTQKFEIKVAIPKNDPEVAQFYGQLFNLARECWPQFVLPDGQITHPQFSLKWWDGDGKDGNGQPNSGKPGHAGHYILKASSGFAPTVHYKDRYADADRITDPKLIKTGDWVRLYLSMQSNNNSMRPGLYINLLKVALWFQDQEIVTGIAASTAFAGAAAGQMPAGATPLPAMGPSNAAAFAVPGNAQPGLPAGPMGGAPSPAMPGAAMPGSAPAAGIPGMGAPMTTPAQPQYVQPNNAIMGAPAAAPAAPVGMPGLPPMPGAQPMQPAAPVYVMTPAAQGYTREQFLAAGQGWTDEKLLASGMMVRQG